jgi:hypothetical protein
MEKEKIVNPTAFERTLARKGSLRDPRTTSPHMLAYLR